MNKDKKVQKFFTSIIINYLFILGGKNVSKYIPTMTNIELMHKTILLPFCYFKMQQLGSLLFLRDGEENATGKSKKAKEQH